MDNLLSPTSVVGCSVSILFCFSTAVVLGCFRSRATPLLIKQQLSIALMITNIVILAGLQGAKSKVSCRLATCFLHYSVISCFSWLCVDQHYILTSVKRYDVRHSFLKIAGFTWAAPLPFVILAPVLGMTSSARFGTKLYECWDSDHVIWSLTVQCVCMMLVSFYMMLAATIGTSSGYWAGMNWLPTNEESKSAEAMKYSLKTNFLMLLVTVTVWIFGSLILWDPNALNYQLIFGFGTALQGLLAFFFYCVFALELDFYVHDRFVVREEVLSRSAIASPVKEAKLSALPVETENLHSYQVSKVHRQLEVGAVRGEENSGLLVKEQSDGMDREDAVRKDLIREQKVADQTYTASLQAHQSISTTEAYIVTSMGLNQSISQIADTSSVREGSQSSTRECDPLSEVPTNSCTTIALVHSPEVLLSTGTVETSEFPIQDPDSFADSPGTVLNTSTVLKGTEGTVIEAINVNTVIAESRNSINLSMQPLAHESTDNLPVAKLHAGNARKPTEEAASFAGLLGSRLAHSPDYERASPVSSECSGSGMVSTSTSSLTSKKKRKAMSTCSYATSMGMNELESLFNNADLMNQSMANYKPAAFNSFYSSNKTNAKSWSSRSVDQSVTPIGVMEEKEESQLQGEVEELSEKPLF